VTCRYHILTALHLEATGGLHNLSDDALADLALSLPETCALDMADEGGVSLEKLGSLLGTDRRGAFMILSRIYSRRRDLFRSRLSGPEEIRL